MSHISRLRLLSLCTGIGGIDYAWSHWLRQEIIGQVEIDPYCTSVLQKHWPGVPRYPDLRELAHDDPFAEADLVAGGIPCQPFSLAGKRRGAQDDRHLWPAAFALIKRQRPRWVLVENVAGFISLALDLVQTDLESAGYTTQAYVLPACALGAPHIRERVFIVAHTTSGRSQIGQSATRPSNQPDASSLLADPCSTGCQTARAGKYAGASLQCSQDVAHPDGDRQRQWENQSQCQPPCGRPSNPGTHGPKRDLSHDRRTARQPQPGVGGVLDGLSRWLDGTRWPTLPGQPQEEWEPPRTLRESIPHRAARLKALGNTLMPQHVYPFLQFMVAYEQGGKQ